MTQQQILFLLKKLLNIVNFVYREYIYEFTQEQYDNFYIGKEMMASFKKGH
jgi:hypothetical protein